VGRQPSALGHVAGKIGAPNTASTLSMEKDPATQVVVPQAGPLG